MFTPYKVDSMWKRQRYSNARAKAALGWAPRVPMSEALDRTFAALARARSGLEPWPEPQRGAAPAGHATTSEARA
jgi:hypothetical protein